MEVINKYIKNIKNTLQYYITNFWYNSFIYNNYVIPILWFNKDLDKYYKTKEEALTMLNKKKYKGVSKKYMINKINEKF